MILLKKCPLCNSLKFNKKLSCTDHTKSKEVFNIVSCETCGFTFTNPRPSEKTLPEYYKTKMYISHTNSKKGVFNWAYQTARRIAIKKKTSLLKKFYSSGSVLDIGCGTGEFLNACKQKGFNPFGIEPSKLARSQAIKNYSLRITEKTNLSQYPKNKFELITMWHVFEHISEIKNTVKELERILKPGGKVFVAVPNHKSWDANYYKEYWAAWDVPIHLWHFSKKTITSLFKKYGLNLKTTKEMLLDSYYVSLLSEEFKFGKKNFLKSFFIGTISNIIGLFTKRGCSSTIYIFEKPI